MDALTVLRRLAEQHNYRALRAACLEADHSDAGVRVLLALADAHLGDTSAARRALASFDCTADRKALSLDARVDMAAIHMALADLEPAVALLEKALEEALEGARHENGDHAVLLARLAWCRLRQGDRDEALRLYQRSLRVRPLLAVYHNLLRLYRDSGRLTEMETCLDAAWQCWTQERIHWPDDQRHSHDEQLRGIQLDLWFAQGRFEAADAWVERQKAALGEEEWCALLIDTAQRLAARDRHAQAEEWLRAGLRRYPQQVGLYGQLAELTQLQGRTRQAVALLTRAIHLAGALGKPTESLLMRLSATALRFDAGLARAAAERARDQLAGMSEAALREADDITEGRLQIEIALAGIESEEANYRAAEQRYRDVLGQPPNAIGAMEGLGQLCMKFGRIDEAVALFEQVNAIDPARGQGALINARRFPEDDATLERLEQIARTPGMEGTVRSGLLFQLAAVWERRADYARAFALVDEANGASRRLLRYDSKIHRQRCARIRHAFSRALFDHRGDSGHDSTLPLFVVGMPRSGTTLVEQIIAGHSRIHGAGELGTLPRVIAGLERWERHTGSGHDYPDCVDDLDAQVIRGIAQNVIEELREYAPDADHVVDKLPHNFENVGLIKLLFPRAKIISVRRDARDVAVSNYFTDYAAKHGGMGFAYHLEWIGEQLTDHERLMQHWQRIFPGEILEIDYEDVVNDVAASARRMLDYIGVEWEPQVLEFHALERPVKTASVWQVRQPLYAGSIGRWRHFEQHLKPLFDAANRSITAEPVEMVSLPEPGWLNTGVDRYRDGDLDGAEYLFKRLLRHLPEHAAAQFMLGLVYVRKGHLEDGIMLMERGVERCPWNDHWRGDLARAYRVGGREQDAAALPGSRNGQTASGQDARAAENAPIHLDHELLSGKSTCPNSGSAVIGTRC